MSLYDADIFLGLVKYKCRLHREEGRPISTNGANDRQLPYAPDLSAYQGVAAPASSPPLPADIQGGQRLVSRVNGLFWRRRIPPAVCPVFKTGTTKYTGYPQSVMNILVQVCTQVDPCGKGPRVATNAPHAWLFDSRRRGGTCLGRHERQVVQTLLRAVGSVHPFLPYILRVVGVNCVGPGVLLQ